MKVLVGRGRIDPVMTAQANAPPEFGREEISEQELNSEAELLRDEELLGKVVRATGLAASDPFALLCFGRDDDDVRVARSVRQLATRLTIEPLRKTNLIKVSYESSDPVLAARVLNSVANSYMEKHTQIHRPSGEFNFFERQTTQYGKRLEEAELQVMEFARDHGVVSATLERDIALQKLGDAGTSYRQLRLRLTETEQRIRSLQMEMSSLPQRTTTQIRTADNPELLEKLKSRLLDLELKRTELLTKYEPSYRLVDQVDQQIAEAKEAIASEAAAPVRDEITDKDPNYEWAKAELKKAQVELSALQARATVETAQFAESRRLAEKLGEDSIRQQDFLRTAKATEESYLLYVRKREEARIEDALDERGILNITIAEQPTVPVLPARSEWTFIVAGFALAGTLSTGLAFASDFLDPAFRTPDEVMAYLGAPVLASLPKDAG
jgi:uncharacterized protein involved in exopolysaccharide biosynthesis